MAYGVELRFIRAGIDRCQRELRELDEILAVSGASLAEEIDPSALAVHEGLAVDRALLRAQLENYERLLHIVEST